MVRCRVRNPGERLQQGPRQDPGCEHQDQEQDGEQGLTQEAAEVFGRTQRSCQCRRRPGSRRRLPRIHGCRESRRRHRRRCSLQKNQEEEEVPEAVVAFLEALWKPSHLPKEREALTPLLCRLPEPRAAQEPTSSHLPNKD
ncbi:Hypothetical predicted protein [Marmota monax]|uniref:Protamine-2 n=1 Tax=Marmota monax TaxID=9995 RepID=A0A5E4BZN0_MARMO|nr:Hypothetical predicted protein [Marmota monax]